MSGMRIDPPASRPGTAANAPGAQGLPDTAGTSLPATSTGGTRGLPLPSPTPPAGPAPPGFSPLALLLARASQAQAGQPMPPPAPEEVRVLLAHLAARVAAVLRQAGEAVPASPPLLRVDAQGRLQDDAPAATRLPPAAVAVLQREPELVAIALYLQQAAAPAIATARPRAAPAPAPAARSDADVPRWWAWGLPAERQASRHRPVPAAAWALAAALVALLAWWWLG